MQLKRDIFCHQIHTFTVIHFFMLISLNAYLQVYIYKLNINRALKNII